MTNNKGIFIGVAVVALIAIGAVVVMVSSSGSQSGNSNGSNSNQGATDTSKSKDTTSTDTSKAVEANTVTIQNYAFDAPVIKVKVGTAVTWTNKDGVRHNISPDSGTKLPEGKLIAKDETYSYTFDKAGTFKYHCTPHPYMKGTVVVTQ